MNENDLKTALNNDSEFKRLITSQYHLSELAKQFPHHADTLIQKIILDHPLLISCIPDIFPILAQTNPSRITQILSMPNAFSFAEMHEGECGAYVRPFIIKKIQTLTQRQENGHPTVVMTQQETMLCFYMIRHLLRHVPASTSDLATIDFLMSIPAVQSVLHRHTTPHQHNELLREALRLNNQVVVTRLMNIPEVLAQAERDGFYPAETRGTIDLRHIAQNTESSMTALSPHEQTMFQRITSRYQPEIDRVGLERAFSNMYQAIAQAYEEQPAFFMRENGWGIKLPLKKEEFDQLAKRKNLTGPEIKNALEAYYQHPTHTALRYLSKPNRFMDPHSSFVNIDPQTGARWSTFTEYKNMITLLWIAANDPNEAPINGFTLESRAEELIQEIALIGRAHNWDTSRTALDQSGKTIKEEFDDLQGDKPSCFSGVKRRLYPNEETASAYAELIANQSIDESRLNSWLSAFNEPQKSAFMAKVHEAYHQEVVVLSVKESMIAFLRNSSEGNKEANQLFKKIHSSEDSALGVILDQWIMKNGANQLVPDLRKKALEIGLGLSDTMKAISDTPSSSSAQELPPMSDDNEDAITMDDLPDDPTGEILVELEEAFSRKKQGSEKGRNVTQDYKRQLPQPDQDDDTGHRYTP